jgi:hypothetical protein
MLPLRSKGGISLEFGDQYGYSEQEDQKDDYHWIHDFSLRKFRPTTFGIILTFY